MDEDWNSEEQQAFQIQSVLSKVNKGRFESSF